MSRKIALSLTILLLLVGIPAMSAQAQSGGPPTETVHVVQRGETLFSIAQQYGVTVDAITHANGIDDPRQVYVGQRLVIPGGWTEDSPQETAPYIVQAGDTVSSIARRYHTTWQTLVQVNKMLSPNTIYVGQVIQVPKLNQPASENEGASTPTWEGTIYVVRPGDTLLRIALRHGISPWTLAVTDHVKSPALIYPGRELIVPGEGLSLLPAPFASLEIQPLLATQGTAMVIAVHTTEPVTLVGKLFGQDVHFAEEGGTYYALVGVHVFTEPGLYELTLTAVDGEGRETALTTEVVVEAGRFGYERIDLPESRSDLLDADVNRIEMQYLMEHQVFTPERRWTLPLQRPCVGTISAYFGSHRAYNSGPYTSYHSGVDYRAPGGTPVYAPAEGTVVLAEPLTVRGNTVVIDHGWGLMTGYWHLSSIEVQVGQQVAPGDLIGKVGNTGLSTGAHLHWEVWAGGVSVNGLQWLEDFYPQLSPESSAGGG
jgi:murein DD-endopeptidase MepM/ murein hydrolase activator NlpD